MSRKKGKKAESLEKEESENIEKQIDLVLVKQLIADQADSIKTYIASALAKQAEDLKLHLDSAINDLNSKFSNLTKVANDLKDSLEFSQQEIAELKVEVEAQKAELLAKTVSISTLETNMAKLQEKVTYQENQSRRNNLRINGIPEYERETWDQTEHKAKNALMEKL